MLVTCNVAFLSGLASEKKQRILTGKEGFGSKAYKMCIMFEAKHKINYKAKSEA